MNLLKGGMRTFHDFDTEQQQGMACSVEALATDDATVILLCWPRRIRPLIRGVSRKKSRRPLQVGRSPMWNRLSSSCRDPWNGSCARTSTGTACAVHELDAPSNNRLQRMVRCALAAEPERQCGRAEDRFMAVRSRRRTSALGRDLPVDMCALLHRVRSNLSFCI